MKIMHSLYEKKTKTKCNANLDIKDVTGNKKIWKDMKYCFSDKSKNSERIVLIRNSKNSSKHHGRRLSAAGLFKYMRPFCYHQVLKG